jgi:acyl carrier protein
VKIQESVINYLRNEMLIGENESVGPDDPLLTSGIIDSFGIIALLDHLEHAHSIRIARNQLTKNSLNTIRSIESICGKVN